jgi:hypothetical protein
MKYISKSLIWIPLPGLTREQIIEEIRKESVGVSDHTDHVWAATVSNTGTMLYCYGLQVGPYEYGGREINVWYIKLIPEAMGPDVYDCPSDILDMCRITNQEWRDELKKQNED